MYNQLHGGSLTFRDSVRRNYIPQRALPYYAGLPLKSGKIKVQA